MSNVKILDCTLRDGGYINNWEFGQSCIKGIISNLESSRIDIIECGFIRKTDSNPNSTVFSSMSSLANRIKPKKTGVLYVVMIEHHNDVYDLIKPYDGNGADIIRVTFRKNEWDSAKVQIASLVEKGYKVCVQPVGTCTYNDESLIKLICDVNTINPYAFYLVDTLGMMYRNDMRHFFYLIDNNLSKNIALGFHSHNNLQLSFSNAQEMIRLNSRRDIIIDSSCYGMGRGVGNLATELFADYINTEIEQKYQLTPLLNIIDKYLIPIYSKQRWGYDLPYFLSAISKCHPNYAAYLAKKETLDIESIEKVLSLIPIDKRSEYDESLIEVIYYKFLDCSIDDNNSYSEIMTIVAKKDVLLLGPGSSIERNRDAIGSVISKGAIVISVNFIPEQFSPNIVFVSNEKRITTISESNLDSVYLVATSNLKNKISANLFFDYCSLLGEGDSADNAGSMMIRILKNAKVNHLYLAGFDGFDVDAAKNYCVSAFFKSIDYNTAEKKNKDISKQFKMSLNGMNYTFITPTKYEI